MIRLAQINWNTSQSLQAAAANHTARQPPNAPKLQVVAQGRVWSGTRAATKGLVDVVGGLWEAIALAKQAAGIPQDEKVTVAEVSRASTSPLALLAGGLGVRVWLCFAWWLRRACCACQWRINMCAAKWQARSLLAPITTKLQRLSSRYSLDKATLLPHTFLKCNALCCHSLNCMQQTRLPLYALPYCLPSPPRRRRCLSSRHPPGRSSSHPFPGLIPK